MQVAGWYTVGEFENAPARIGNEAVGAGLDMSL